MLEADIERDIVVREPLSDVTPLEEGARGIAATVGDERIAVVTAGGPIEIGGATIAHDGAFAAVTLVDGGWSTLYLQDGTQLSIDGETVLTLPEAGTVSVWRDDAGEIRSRMYESLAPHAAPVRAEFALAGAAR